MFRLFWVIIRDTLVVHIKHRRTCFLHSLKSTLTLHNKPHYVFNQIASLTTTGITFLHTEVFTNLTSARSSNLAGSFSTGFSSVGLLCPNSFALPIQRIYGVAVRVNKVLSLAGGVEWLLPTAASKKENSLGRWMTCCRRGQLPLLKLLLQWRLYCTFVLLE